MNEPVSDQGFPSSSIPPAFPSTNVPHGAMTFGQILDRVLQLMRANWRLFVGIALVPGTGMIAYFGVMFAAFFPLLKPLMMNQPPHFSIMTIVWFSAAYIFGVILMILICALYEPAGVYAALEATTGTRVTFRKAWAVAWSKAGRYVWLAILRADCDAADSGFWRGDCWDSRTRDPEWSALQSVQRDAGSPVVHAALCGSDGLCGPGDAAAGTGGSGVRG
jgi:hypothetical protein